MLYRVCIIYIFVWLTYCPNFLLCCQNIFLSGLLLSFIYFLNIYCVLYDIIFRIASCIMIYFMNAPLCRHDIFMNAYYVVCVIYMNDLLLSCEFLWIPIVVLCIFMNIYCCLVHIYEWPIIVLYILPNAYCVDITFLYGLLCFMIHISFKSYYSSHIVQIQVKFSSQFVQVIPIKDELVRRIKLFNNILFFTANNN